MSYVLNEITGTHEVPASVSEKTKFPNRYARVSLCSDDNVFPPNLRELAAEYVTKWPEHLLHGRGILIIGTKPLPWKIAYGAAVINEIAWRYPGATTAWLSLAASERYNNLVTRSQVYNAHSLLVYDLAFLDRASPEVYRWALSVYDERHTHQLPVITAAYSLANLKALEFLPKSFRDLITYRNLIINFAEEDE